MGGAEAADLVRRIGQGERRAEGELVERYRRAVSLLLRHRCRDPERARDVFQDTFVLVIQRLRNSGLQQPELLANFIQRTAANLLIGERRRDGRQRTETAMDVIEGMVEHSPGPADLIDRAADARMVREVIAELGTSRDREILYRYYVEDEEKERICRDLELSSLHFNRVLHRARQRFMDRLAARSAADSHLSTSSADVKG
jgi:RNA polymerase sigma-70 factor (ECF subfamily)